MVDGTEVRTPTRPARTPARVQLAFPQRHLLVAALTGRNSPRLGWAGLNAA
jgi:hypothetical protein